MRRRDIGIVNYNAGNQLTNSKPSVLAEGARHVFVVDNHSHDESLAYLEASISNNRVRSIRNGNGLNCCGTLSGVIDRQRATVSIADQRRPAT